MIQHRKIDKWLWIFGGLIFTTIIIRCFTVPPFWDEILNYHTYVRTGQFMPFTSYLDANNHFLSTLLNYVAYQLLGDNISYMRLFEALSFILFFYYLTKIKSFFQHSNVGLLMVLTISLSTFILSYFSLARGYGMSLAFLTGAMYYLFTIDASKNKIRTSFYFFLFFSLALWSNLSLIPSLLLLFLLFSIAVYKNRYELKQREWLKLVVITLTVGIFPLILALKLSFVLKNAGALWIGGNTGFVPDVILNLTYETLGNKGIWMLLSIFILLSLALIFNRGDIRIKTIFSQIIVLFFGSLLGSIGLHFFLNVNYPKDRAALHFVLLGILFLFFLIDQFKGKWGFIALYPFLIFALHFSWHFNFSYTSTWRYYTVDKETYKVLKVLHSPSEDLPLISGTFGFGNVIDYFAYQENINLNTVQWSYFPNAISDIVLTTREDKIENAKLYDTLYFNVDTKIAVLERRNKTNWESLPMLQRSEKDIPLNAIPIEIFGVELQEKTALRINVKLNLQSKDEIHYEVLVISLKNEAGEEFVREGLLLNQFYKDYTNPKIIRKSVCFPNLDAGKYSIDIYLQNDHFYEWKINAKEIEIEKMDL